jgi:hypothetical protein
MSRSFSSIRPLLIPLALTCSRASTSLSDDPPHAKIETVYGETIGFCLSGEALGGLRRPAST